MNGTFRKMKYKDIDKICELEREAFTLPWPKEAFEDEMTNSLACYTVYEHHGKIKAYGGMWIVLDEAHITNIAVKAEYRRKGIGSRLIDYMVKTAKEKGAKYMYLEVRKSNKDAYQLYIKKGFIINGVRKNYYPDNGEDAIVMMKLIV